MAIYKLEDISTIKRGSSPRPIQKWLRKSPGLMWAKISDIYDNKILNTKQWIDLNWKNKALLGNYGDLFITNSATPGIAFIQKNKNNIAYHDGFLKIIPNKKIILKKYLLYKLIKDRDELIKMGNGAIFINLSSKILKDWKVKLVSLIEQQKIIDIIEPFEKLIKIMKKIILKIENYSKNIQIINNEKIKINKIIDDYSNGFAYKKEHIDDYGKYKIFTIKNIQDKEKFKKSNYFKNNKLNIGDLITGLSGTIGSVDVIGEENWVGNQRTLQLKTKYFLEIKSIIEINKIKLLKKAKGAAQKNISHSDILNLKVFIKKFNQEISNFYLIIKKNIQNIQKIKFLMIDLLIK